MNNNTRAATAVMRFLLILTGLAVILIVYATYQANLERDNAMTLAGMALEWQQTADNLGLPALTAADLARPRELAQTWDNVRIGAAITAVILLIAAACTYPLTRSPNPPA